MNIKTPKPLKFKDLQQKISELNSNDQVVITMSVVKNERVDTLTASNKFPTNDIQSVRAHLSETLHSIYLEEARQHHEQAAADDAANKIKNMLE